MNAQHDLLEWIKEHKVCWELVPYYVFTSEGKIQVGFELDLYAQIDAQIRTNPGSTASEQIFEKLAHVARLSFPQDRRPTRYDIQVFDASFHYRKETKLKPEIQLTLLITHRQDFFHTVDECERRCAGEIEEHLKGLGVQRKIWTQRTSPNIPDCKSDVV